VKTILCKSGERLPTLINARNGIPDFDSTLWVVSVLRGRGLASATLEQALRSTLVLYKVFELLKINLSDRFNDGSFISIYECELVAKVAKLKSKEISTAILDTSKEITSSRVLANKNLEKLRSTAKVVNQNAYVGKSTVAIRLFYIRLFLYWRITREIHRASSLKKSKLLELRKIVDQELLNLTPIVTERNLIGNREGLSSNSLQFLLHIIKPEHPKNPWLNNFVKVRNQLIISVLVTLGIRRGELLGLRINDLKPLNQEIYILRRPDDILDPRINEPNTKTRDRVLSLSESVYRLIKLYIQLRHQVVKGKHHYLFVATNGNPLSKSGLQRVFDELSVHSEFKKLSPHILRHTFFENLANELYEAGVGDNEALVYLRQQGGWSDNSDSPRIYTKRFVQEKANEALANLQDKLLFINAEDKIDG